VAYQEEEREEVDRVRQVPVRAEESTPTPRKEDQRKRPSNSALGCDTLIRYKVYSLAYDAVPQ